MTRHRWWPGPPRRKGGRTTLPSEQASRTPSAPSPLLNASQASSHLHPRKPRAAPLLGQDPPLDVPHEQVQVKDGTEEKEPSLGDARYEGSQGGKRRDAKHAHPNAPDEKAASSRLRLRLHRLSVAARALDGGVSEGSLADRRLRGGIGASGTAEQHCVPTAQWSRTERRRFKRKFAPSFEMVSSKVR
jgi:hypothetical protein